MKKIFKVLISSVLAVTVVLGSIACKKDNEWTSSTLGGWGAVTAQSGFVAQTENNLYFINGQGVSTDDNELGAVTKGALVGISKADFKAGKFENTTMVVPKLFTSSDYKSGVYVYGDYVYYGTPNTEKDSNGEIANGEMVITKTKLDGTGTERIVKLTSNALEFRILNANDVIYVVYYDTADSALKVFSNGETTTLAKTDAETNDAGYESLAEFKFIENAKGGDIALVYTTTVYSEKYYEDKAKENDYARETASYNKVYAYKAGEVIKVKNDGETKDNLTYALTYADTNYIFYTATDLNSKATTYGAKIAEIADSAKAVKLNDNAGDYLKDTNLIISLEEVYAMVAETTTNENGEQEAAAGGSVYKTTLTGNESAVKQVVAISSTISKILFIDGGYIYYYDTANQISRVQLSTEGAKEEIVSSSTVSTSWYKPVKVDIDGEVYMLYLDNSATGLSYVKTIKLTGNVAVGEDTDGNGEDDVYRLSGNSFVAIKNASDTLSLLTALTDEMLANTTLEYIEKDGALVFEQYNQVASIYASLSKEQLEEVAEDYKTKIENAKIATELANKYYKLNGIENGGSDAMLNAYNDAKAYKDGIAEEKRSAVFAMIENNLNWNYQQAAKLYS